MGEEFRNYLFFNLCVIIVRVLEEDVIWLGDEYFLYFLNLFRYYLCDF